MKILRTLTCSLLASVAAGFAAELPPEKLLPSDALLVVTVPNVAEYRAAFRASATGRLWADPSLRPFKEKFLAKLRSSVLEPLERELGIRWEDYEGLVQGQLTWAITRVGTESGDGSGPGLLMFVDSGENASLLENRLQALNRKWVEAGRTVRNQRIRDVEFSVLIARGEDLLRPLEAVAREVAEGFGAEDLPAPGPDDVGDGSDEPSEGSVEIILGRKASLLLIGTRAKDLERVLAREAGGLDPALDQNPDFQVCHQAMLRDTLAYGWLNFRPLYEALEQQVQQAAGNAQTGSLMPSPDRVLRATGLSELRGMALGIREDAAGSAIRCLVVVPENGRRGLFGLLTQQSREAIPPRFVPADALSYSRWRLDLKQSWAALESMITDISPQWLTMFQFALATMGGEQSASFNLREDIIAHLGDDLVTYMKLPRDKTASSLATAPEVMLIGSDDAEALLAGLRSMLSMLPPPLSALKEREFLGRKIYTLDLALAAQLGGTAETESLSFVASGGYLAISDGDAALEEYLRSSESSVRPLRDFPGLAQAAQRVGGMSTGLLGFENSREALRIIFESVRGSDSPLSALFGVSPSMVGLDESAEAAFREWLDFSLLPDFDRIAKYIGLTVYTGRWTAEGYRVDMVSPTPPELNSSF